MEQHPDLGLVIYNTSDHRIIWLEESSKIIARHIIASYTFVSNLQLFHLNFLELFVGKLQSNFPQDALFYLFLNEIFPFY